MNDHILKIKYTYHLTDYTAVGGLYQHLTNFKFEAWFEGRLVGDKLVLVSVIINSFSLTIEERSVNHQIIKNYHQMYYIHITTVHS